MFLQNYNSSLYRNLIIFKNKHYKFVLFTIDNAIAKYESSYQAIQDCTMHTLLLYDAGSIIYSHVLLKYN